MARAVSYPFSCRFPIVEPLAAALTDNIFTHYTVQKVLTFRKFDVRTICLLEISKAACSTTKKRINQADRKRVRGLVVPVLPCGSIRS